MPSQFSPYKILSSFKATVEDITLDTINYLTARFNQSKAVFTAASPFGQILIVIENLTQLIFYYIEDSITELNINEATRLTSIYSLASLAGHNPSRATSAIGEISLLLETDETDLPADYVIISNLTRLTSENNGLIYLLDLPQDQIKFSLRGEDNGLKLQIRQGIIESQTFTGSGKPLTSFSVASPQSYFIDNFYVNVYVNDRKWKRYESMLDIPLSAPGFIIKTGITSGLDLYFGNGSYGLIPPPGSKITVEYIVTEGPGGNIKTTNTSSVNFSFDDTGFTITGEEVDLNKFIKIKTENPPYFGTNPESADLTRLIAPKNSKSFALVNPDHYEIVLRRLGLFSLISIYLDPVDDRMLNLFLIPDITRSFNTPQSYFGADLDIFRMSQFQKSELLKYLEKSGSKLVSTDIKIIDPVIIKYVINLSIIVFDDVPVELIKSDIYSSLGLYFINNTRRNRIPKSDLIKIIEEVKGVDSVAVTIVGELNEAAKSANPGAALIGLDDYNDIIITDGQLPIIRGGFSDRFGNQYASGIGPVDPTGVLNPLGAVNIRITDIVPRQLN
jgi:hypothetical protein